MQTSRIVALAVLVGGLCIPAPAAGGPELWGPADEGTWQLIDLSGGRQQDDYSYVAPDGTRIVSNRPHRKHNKFWYHQYLVDHSYFVPPFNDMGFFVCSEGSRVDVDFIFPEPRRVDKVVVYPYRARRILADYSLSYSRDGKVFEEIAPPVHAEFLPSEYDDFLGNEAPWLMGITHNTRGLVAKVFRTTILNRGKPGEWYGLNEMEFYQLAQAPRMASGKQKAIQIKIVYCPDHVPAGETFPVIFEVSEPVGKVTTSCTANATLVGEEPVSLPAGLHKCFFRVNNDVESGEVAVALSADGQKARYGGITPIPRELFEIRSKYAELFKVGNYRVRAWSRSSRFRNDVVMDWNTPLTAVSAEHIATIREHGQEPFMGYICPISWFGNPEKRDDFYEIYDDRWEEEVGTPKPPTDPSEWNQQDINGENVYAYSHEYRGRIRWAACINNPYRRQWDAAQVRKRMQEGYFCLYFDNPMFAPGACYCPYCMEKFKIYAKRTYGLEPEDDSLESIRALAAENPRLFRRFRVATWMDFLIEMKQVGKAANPDFMMGNNISQTRPYKFYRDPNIGISFIDRAKILDCPLTEPMSLPMVPGWHDGEVGEYGAETKLNNAVLSGKTFIPYFSASVCPSPELVISESIATRKPHFISLYCHKPRGNHVKLYNDFIEQNKQHILNSESMADVLLYYPTWWWLRTTYCGTAELARALVRANVQFDVATEETLTPELLSKYRAFTVGHSSMLTHTERAWVDDFDSRGGVVVMGESANGGPNLLENPSFEDIDKDSGLPSHWDFRKSSQLFACCEEGSFHGERHLKYEREGEGKEYYRVRQLVPVEPGMLYSYSFWAKTDGSHYAGYVRKGSEYRNVVASAAPAGSQNGWTQYVALVRAPQSETNLWLTMEQYMPGVSEYDAVEFRQARVTEALFHGLGQPLVTLNGPDWLRTFVRKKGDTTIVHLLNYHVERTGGGSGTERKLAPALDLKEVENLTVTLRMPPAATVSSVECLTPDLALNTEADEPLEVSEAQSYAVKWESNKSEEAVLVTVKIRKLRIWNMLVVK